MRRHYQKTIPEIVCSHNELIEKSILAIQYYEKLALEHDPENGYWLAFSGGKDSVVIKELAIRAGIKFQAHYSVTTIDPPELCKFIKQYHPDVIWERPKRAFLKRIKHKGLPTRLVRWCCQEYKENGGNGKVKILGVRYAESATRKSNWQTITKWNSKNGGWCLNPILHWNDGNIWKFIHENKLPYCSLYDQGFKRLGCVGCPLAATKNRLMEFRKWPQYEKAWRRAANAYWESTKGDLNRQGKPYYCSRFKTGNNYFDWWLSDNPSPKEDDCQMGLW